MNSSNSKITVFLPTTTIDPRHIVVNAANPVNPVNADNADNAANPVSFCSTMQMQPR